LTGGIESLPDLSTAISFALVDELASYEEALFAIR